MIKTIKITNNIWFTCQIANKYNRRFIFDFKHKNYTYILIKVFKLSIMLTIWNLRL